jgi:hypothetical protein
MAVSEPDKVIDVMLVQFSKAPTPTAVTLAGTEAVVMVVQLAKAQSATAVTAVPPTEGGMAIAPPVPEYAVTVSPLLPLV